MLDHMSLADWIVVAVLIVVEIIIIRTLMKMT